MPNQSLICFHGNSSWSMYNFRREIFDHFRKMNFRVGIIAPLDEFTEKLKKEGNDIYNIAMSRKGKNPFGEMLYFCKLLYLYFKLKPAVIFHYTIKPNIYGSFAAFLLKIPSVAVVTGLGYVFSQSGFQLETVKLLYKIAFSFSKKIWFLNKEDATLFLNLRLVKSEKMDILPSEGINTDHFQNNNKQQCSDTHLIFLFIARILWDKGIKEVVAGAQILKKLGYKAKFQVLGPIDTANPTGVSPQRIKDWTLDGSIEYLGITKDVRPFILKADCIVLPSFYKEGVPRVLLEAAAMEKPIITTDTPGCRDTLVNNQTGFLCKPRDLDDFVKQCVKILTMSSADRKKMGIAGKNLVSKKFDVKIVIQRYRKIVDQLLT